jgi:hypothetical protein
MIIRWSLIDRDEQAPQHLSGVPKMAAIKKTGTRLARWFKAVREKNQPPYRWYEHSLYNA